MSASCARVRPVLDLGPQRQEAGHGLEIGDRLLELAVDHAQDVERLVELEQEGVDQHDVADRERARDHALRGRDHDRGDAERDDRGLAEVERGEADPRLDRGALVAGERAVDAQGLVVLVGEGLDGLVVEQAVDRLGADLVVVEIELAAELGPPLGRDDAERGIGGDREERDQREPPGIAREQDADHERELEQRREDVEQHHAEHEGDRLDAAVDRARELAGAALEVVAQRQAEQMAEDRERDLAPGVLLDAREDRIAGLGEERRAEARPAIGEQREQRQRERHLRAGRGKPGAAQAIDHRLVGERHRDVDELGGEQEGERHDDAQPQRARILGPQMRCHLEQRLPQAAHARGPPGGVTASPAAAATAEPSSTQSVTTPPETLM